VFVDGKEPNPPADLGDNTLDKVKPVENWLGKSSFSADPGLSAAIDEFRVYDQALTPKNRRRFQGRPRRASGLRDPAPAANAAKPAARNGE